MDKSPDIAKLFPAPASSVMCEDALAKAALVSRIVSWAGKSAVVLDLDLQHSGYANAGMGPAAEAYVPEKDSWKETFGSLIRRVSSSPSVLVIDSLNGFFGIFAGKDSGMHADAAAMMACSCCAAAGGRAFVASVAGQRDGAWVMYPSGRRALEGRGVARFFARGREEIEVDEIGGARSFRL